MKRLIGPAVVAGLALGLLLWEAGGCPSARAGGYAFPEGVALPGYYPERFTGTGRIDRMGETEIVIDDTLHGLSPSVTFATPQNRHASWRVFRPGRYVGYVEDRHRRITSLWLLP